MRIPLPGKLITTTATTTPSNGDGCCDCDGEGGGGGGDCEVQVAAAIHNRLSHRWNQHQAYENLSIIAAGSIPIISEEPRIEFETRIGTTNKNYKKWKKISPSNSHQIMFL